MPTRVLSLIKGPGLGGTVKLLVMATPYPDRDRVLHLLRNPSIRRAMGEAARARVQEAYSIERMVPATEDVYVEVSGRRRPGLVVPAKAGDCR